MPLNNFLHSFGFICGTPLAFPAISCKHLVSIFYSSHTPVPPSNFLHSCGFNIQASPPRLSTASCMHRHFGFNIFALIWFGSILPPGPRPLPLHKLLAFILFQYLRFLPGAPQQLPAFILFQYLNFLPGAPQQLPEFISFQIWFLRCLSTFSCMHLVSIPRLRPLVSPQSLACFVIWVWCLIGFTPHLSTAYCAHLVLISNFLSLNVPLNFLHPFGFICTFPLVASPQVLAFMLFQYPNFSCTPVPLSNFLHEFGFNISASPVSQRLLALIWFQYLTITPPPHVPLSNFIWFQHFPSHLWTTFCTHLSLVSMSKLPLSLNNFLRSSGFST